jgi:hypothetical protein
MIFVWVEYLGPVYLGDVIAEDSPTWLKRLLEISRATTVTWALPTHQRLRAKTHASLHVNCPFLLSDFNRNWNVSTNFS